MQFSTTCLAAATALWASFPAVAQDQKISVSGALDWYYMYNMNHPPVGAIAGLRAYDIKNDQFAFNLAEVVISRAVSAQNPVGFTAALIVGKTADIVHGTEPGGMETYKNVLQLFGTYQTRGERPLTLDFGKFTTWIGYEVIESWLNDNYSRGLLHWLSQPAYHAGLRATMPLSDTVTGGLYLVNGWNNVEDDNGGKTVGASLNFKPSSSLNLIANVITGSEGAGAGLPANLATTLFDIVAVWNATPKLKVALNADFANSDTRVVAAGKGSTTVGGDWSGWSLIGRLQVGASSAAALRVEQFDDSDGVRTGASQKVNSYTGTFEYSPSANLLHRLELRLDSAGSAIFPSGGGGGKRQSTLTFSQVVKY
jgi:hypothetical protein